MRKAIFIIFILSISSISIISQELDLYRNYLLENFYNLNPAASGLNGSFISQVSVSKKWLGIKGSPSTQNLSNSIRLGEEGFYDENMFLNRPLFNLAKRVGIGLTIFNESNGPLYHTGLLFAYAYHLPIQKNILSFGMSGLITHYRLDTKQFEPVDEGDPDLYTNNSAWVPDANIGVMYHNKQFYTGVSVISLFNANKIMDQREPEIVVFGGYKFDINGSLIFEPSLFIWKSGKSKISADYNAKLFFGNELCFLISLRSNKDISAGLSMNLSQGICFKYTYAINTTGLVEFYQGSHYVAISIDIARIANRNL